MALTPAGEKAKQQILELMNLIRSEVHFYGMSPTSIRVNSQLESRVVAVVEALCEAAQEAFPPGYEKCETPFEDE